MSGGRTMGSAGFPATLSPPHDAEAAPAADAIPLPVSRRIRLWDLPLRLFHWSLAVAVVTAIVSAELGGNAMAWHGRAGVLIAALLAFRFVWGALGPDPARFAHFAPTPAAVRAYLGGQWRGVGHNPLGALSVFALLGLLAAQVATGLVGNDDIAFTGPLARFVDDDLSHRLTGWHKGLSWGLFVLLGLHLAAIAFYTRVRKAGLLGPMITGWRSLPPDVHPPPRTTAPRGAFGLAMAVALGSAGVLVWVDRPDLPASLAADDAAAVATTAAGPAAAASGGAARAPAW